jgi:hypothetical protein
MTNNPNRAPSPRFKCQRLSHPGIGVLFMLLCCCNASLRSQSAAQGQTSSETAQEKIDRLAKAVADAQQQMESYQKQLIELRQQIDSLQQQVAAEKAAQGSAKPAEGSQPVIAKKAEPAAATTATIDEVKERQAILESEIATHEVTKVETASKYPLKVSGLILFNAFVNTRQVDTSASPAYAIDGPGSTGLSLRQTVLGLDARGPHLFNAASHADVRIDFFANYQQANYAAGGVLRMRTAHAMLTWPSTEAFIELDRSILEPNEPSSVVAVAQPEMAWAGNLWNWSPQIGVTHNFNLTDDSQFKVQGALIDASDPGLPGSESNEPVTQTERSRWPGTEARIAYAHGPESERAEVGIGGYFSPHRSPDGVPFKAWAATIDTRFPLSRYFEFTANAYRGQALAGLGGGGYVNYFYQYAGAVEVAHALDDVGGWTQLKAKAGQKVEFNTGYGTDNPFAKEVHQAVASSTTNYYPGLARNRSFYSNVIFSPSAYLLFSLEYKRLWSSYGSGATQLSDSVGIAAGYRF